MKLSHEEVLKIANLARLELSADEVDLYATQLSSILEYVETLKHLNVEGIEPTAHAVTVPTPTRADEPAIDPTREASLKNAPDRDGDFFRVPKVIT